MKTKQIEKETMNDFEEVGEDNFGSRIKKIDWKKILKNAALTIFIGLVLFMILR